MSYAQVVQKSIGRGPTKHGPRSLVGIERARCLVLHTPSPPPKTETIAIALQKAFPDLAPKLQLFIDNGRVLVQHEESVDPARLLEKGLLLNKIQSKFSPVHNTSKQNNLIELNLKGIDSNSNTDAQLKAVLAEYGKPIEITYGTWPGTSVKNGEANVLLDVTNAQNTTFPRTFDIDLGENMIKIQYKAVGVLRHCYRCRSTNHVRAVCPTAPPCAKCGERSHPEWFCKKAAKSPAPQPQPSKEPASLPAEMSDCINEAIETQELDEDWPTSDADIEAELVPSAIDSDARLRDIRARAAHHMVMSRLPDIRVELDARGEPDLADVADYAEAHNLTSERARELFQATFTMWEVITTHPVAVIDRAVRSEVAFWSFVRSQILGGKPSIQIQRNNAAAASNLTVSGAGSSQSVL